MDEGISKAVGCLSALALALAILLIILVLSANYCERMQTVTGNGLGVLTCRSDIMQGVLDLVYWLF